MNKQLHAGVVGSDHDYVCFYSIMQFETQKTRWIFGLCYMLTRLRDAYCNLQKTNCPERPGQKKAMFRFSVTS